MSEKEKNIEIEPEAKYPELNEMLSRTWTSFGFFINDKLHGGEELDPLYEALVSAVDKGFITDSFIFDGEGLKKYRFNLTEQQAREYILATMVQLATLSTLSALDLVSSDLGDLLTGNGPKESYQEVPDIDTDED